MKQNIIELIGVVFLVLIAGLTQDAFATGIAYVILLCITLQYSQGYLNPAITLAKFITKKIKIDAAIQLWIAQILWWVIWALLVRFFQWSPMNIFPVDGIPLWKIGAIEMVFSFFIAAIALYITKKETTFQYISAAVVGLAFFVAIVAIGKTTGWALNPAIATGSAVIDWIYGGKSWTYLWLYLISTLLGGFFAGIVSYNKYEKQLSK